MPDSKTFDAVVAGRTRAATHLLTDGDLLARYVDLGGLEDDLRLIQTSGREAELLTQAQGTAKSGGKVATLDVLVQFSTLLEEYTWILAVLRAIAGMLARNGASAALTQRLADIIANHAQTGLVDFEAADGTKTKRATKRRSQEALRAEIERDAVALLDFSELTPYLEARKVTRARLEKLRADATALSQRLSDRTAKKGAGKGATKEVHAAVSAQREAWRAAYPLLAMLARDNTVVAGLLKDAARTRR